ncbi:transmembrane protein 64 [Chrysoperla carnea]|uniref:transmembrane protein 64 n=1 Tax=Chrysoperla carnea TaxID=189513 RepID=UPI001D093BE7|nr:transmembrane protein 64 [Chrysoperla carnea]
MHNPENDLEVNNPRKSSLCSRVSNVFNYTTILNTIITILGITILIIVVLLSKDYIKSILIRIEKQDPLVIFLIYIVLFIIVSFPVVIGYLFLIISCGYLLGLLHGLFTIVIAVNIGVFVAHNVIRLIHKYFHIRYIENNEVARAILKILSGPQAFKVVLCTRLTPIPFGLQNTIFALSSVSWKRYHIATALGLLPAQLINVYLGSTLRSMHDVIDNHAISPLGYTIFAAQIIIGISVMMWVLCKARLELTRALEDVENGHNNTLATSDSSDLGSHSYILA